MRSTGGCCNCSGSNNNCIYPEQTIEMFQESGDAVLELRERGESQQLGGSTSPITI